MTDTELRRLAENATPGPWEVGVDRVWSRAEPDSESVCEFPAYDVNSTFRQRAWSNARYIAAASPDVILALLDRCERAERERDAMDADLTVLAREYENQRTIAEEMKAERDARPAISREDAGGCVGRVHARHRT